MRLGPGDKIQGEPAQVRLPRHHDRTGIAPREDSGRRVELEAAMLFDRPVALHAVPVEERLERLHAEMTRHIGRLEGCENSAYLEVWHLYYPEGTSDYYEEALAPEAPEGPPAPLCLLPA